MDLDFGEAVAVVNEKKIVCSEYYVFIWQTKGWIYSHTRFFFWCLLVNVFQVDYLV